MSVAGFASTWRARKDGGEGAGEIGAGRSIRGGRGEAGGQAIERGGDGGEVLEGIEAVGAGAKFAGCLGTAEEKQAEDGGLIAAEVESGAGAVLILGNAGVARGGDEAEVLEGVQRLADVLLG